MNNNTKRKRGRPAGSTSFARVKIADLIAQLGTNFTITVSKKWLEDIGLEVDSDLVLNQTELLLLLNPRKIKYNSQ